MRKNSTMDMKKKLFNNNNYEQIKQYYGSTDP